MLSAEGKIKSFASRRLFPSAHAPYRLAKLISLIGAFLNFQFKQITRQISQIDTGNEIRIKLIELNESVGGRARRINCRCRNHLRFFFRCRNSNKNSTPNTYRGGKKAPQGRFLSAHKPSELVVIVIESKINAKTFFLLFEHLCVSLMSNLFAFTDERRSVVRLVKLSSRDQFAIKRM